MMLLNLLWILAPLFIGFFTVVRSKTLLKLIDHSLMILIYLILFVMGLSLATMENLNSELGNILWQTAIYIVCILGMNLLFCIYLDRALPVKTQKAADYQTSTWGLVWNAAKLLGAIVAGIFVGQGILTLNILAMHDFKVINDVLGQGALMLLLLFVGIQLRSNGIGLKAVFLNRYGLILSVAVIISSFVGGIIAAWFNGRPVLEGLAISSGFGWYSLSASVLQKSLGPTVGSIAFFNDLFREFFAFAVIPLLMARYPLSAVASGGATSLDFVLPLIQKTGGIKVVPIAISFGFIINLVAPFFLVFFGSLAQ
ncbi:lysine exporter LysO family protein [Wohlfahrtiimonas chitiniclastica]|uniref:Lysine exporter LysO family protein n=1 Tax=Wohlfahrtiimonas chitiniclastica TaxID=400946 RepID=A0AB35BY03_9GAMM|nr:lysine exporter LysO family protein [Wohlfahrtiimonas chitiniclastica]MBS7824591.1 lysine exporter LysO family protein [Wohlfahrtiimonas chitiniclastica]MBS7840054.1 lysine exporter LysO family protein [Wohlfahrtiimonas chitiniclastica]